VRFRNATVLALGMVALGGPLASAGSTPQPTQTQIRNAVQAAERSSDLWATVNVCDTRRHRDQLGLRGEMPALGFSSGLFMTFEVYYRSGHKFKADRRTKEQDYLGRMTGSSVHQAGVTFTFTPPTVLRGKVVFSWKLNGKVIGQVTRMTTAHHKHVDFGDPSGYSAASCSIR
jgi:hypothetical protein